MATGYAEGGGMVQFDLLLGAIWGVIIAVA
jgi:hypothetical protein